MLNIEAELIKELEGKNHMPLINNLNCINFYKRYICKINFIPCNTFSKIFFIFFYKKKENETMNLCADICDSYVNSCQNNPGTCENLAENVKNYKKKYLFKEISKRILNFEIFIFIYYYSFIQRN